MLAVLGTVATWYVGDAFYNDYANRYTTQFTTDVLEDAWWQVAWFIVAFLLLSPLIHVALTGKKRQRSSHMFRLLQNGVGDPQFQVSLNNLFRLALGVWGVLVLIALFQLRDQIPYYFFPFLGYKADPWGRGQIGGGLSAVLSLAGNIQMFLAAMFGLVAALAYDRRVRGLALIACFLTWPNYIFDRTRNSMLVIVLPGMLSWIFLRLKGGWLKKAVILGGCFLLVNAWMAFVIANRHDTSIAAAVRGDGVGLAEASGKARHEGLNMFEELCWVNTFIKDGTLNVNNGANYWANLANPIPRALWPDKPLIALDYAVARGQNYTATGTTATVSTGLIGQGVINFGGFLGPTFAALLMALWAAFLARLDTRGNEMGKFGLFQLGLIETFNLGRDITFIPIYPVLFGLGIVWLMSKRTRGRKRPSQKIKSGNRFTSKAN